MSIKLKRYMAVIEDPKGNIIHYDFNLPNGVVNTWAYAKKFVNQYYGKGYILCDVYEV